MIFVDTAAFVARHITSDGQHERATRAWRELSRRGLRCYTSNFVIDETLTLLSRRVSPSFAVDRGRVLYASDVLEILRPDEAAEREAVERLAKLGDQGPSFTDCVSFVLMKRQRLRRAFTFDRHFVAAGFEIWPD